MPDDEFAAAAPLGTRSRSPSRPAPP